MGVRLTPELTDFVESGISILIGTRDLSLRPKCARAIGAKVSPGGETVSVFLPEAMAQDVRAHLSVVPQLAVAFSRPFDHLSLQLKGPVLEVRPSTPAEQALQERYLAAYGEVLYYIGLPRSLVQRVRPFPSLAVRFEVMDIFEQTPGPLAGKRHALAGGV